MIILPTGFDVEAYQRSRVDNELSRVRNDVGNFAGFGAALDPGLNGQFVTNPFGLPNSPNAPGSQTLSQFSTVFTNLRWYFISQFRQVLSEAYVELGLVQTIVDVPVDDAFRGGVEVKSKQLSPEQIEELQISLDRDDDLTTVAQAAKWTRLFGGGAVLILTDQDPKTPLDLEAITEDSPLEFRAVDLWELFWDQQNTSGYSPQIQEHQRDFYNYYGEQIHKSRVMRMKGLTAPSFVRPRLRGWGFSVVEILVRSINQYLKATDLAFEVLDEFKLDVYKLKNLVNTLLAPQGASRVRQRVAVANQIKNFQNAIVMDSEDEYEQKQLSFSGLAEVMQQIRLQVASDMRMPLTKLFGISAAGFNSGEDDIENYNSTVESQVRNKVKYIVLRTLEIKCQKMFGLIPDDLSVTFKPLRVMSATDEETVKTSKFNRLLSARQANEITTEQFIDACNKGQLFDILLEKDVLLNPDDGDTVKESLFDDPYDQTDPGSGRADSRAPIAPSPDRQKPLMDDPELRASRELARDKVKSPGLKHPFETGEFERGEDRPKKPAEPKKDPEWLDEAVPEDEEAQHEVRLEKPKEKGAAGDAPDAPEPKGTKPKTGAAPSPREAEAPEPRRRINNEKTSRLEKHVWSLRYDGASIEDIAKKISSDPYWFKGSYESALTKVKEILQETRKNNGKMVRTLDASRNWIKRGDLVKVLTGVKVVDHRNRDAHDRPKIVVKANVVGTVQSIDADGTIMVGSFRDRDVIEDFIEVSASSVVKSGASVRNDDLGKQLPGDFSVAEFQSPDLVQRPGDTFTTPDDKTVDPRRVDSEKLDTRNIAVVAVVAGSGGQRKILTGKRRDTGLWVSPGGHVEPGEDWRYAAQRELAEEAGIEVPVNRLEDLDLVAQDEHVYPDHTTVVRLYCLYLTGTLPARTTQDPDQEVSVWRWVPLSTTTPELKSWNRHADEDIVVKNLTKLTK